MKFKYLFAFILTLLSASCKPVEVPVDPVLEVTPDRITVAAAGADVDFTVLANEDWSVQSDALWLSTDPASGVACADAVTVKVTVSANDTDEERTAAVTVKTESLTQTVTVVQEAAPVAGNGTESSPYLIKDVEDLKSMKELASLENATWFKLVNDLDMSSVSSWTPVTADPANVPEIHLDGNGMTISNFSSSADTYPSLFGVFKGSCSSLTMSEASINAKTDKVGCLAAVTSDASFTDCSVDVVIKANTVKYVGGLIGYAESGALEVRNCSVAGSVNGYSYMGGVIGGQSTKAKVSFEDCRCSAKVAGMHHYTGGFAGHMDNTLANKLVIKNCHTSGNVTSGGSSCSTFLAFVAQGADIEGCYATGTVKAVNNLGGIVAWAAAGSGAVNLKDCFFTGEVSGKMSLGGLVGYSEGALNIENCYVHGRVAGITGIDADGAVINTSLNAGGLLGQKAEGHVDVKNSHFSGYVFAYQRAGGVLSYLGAGTASMSQVYSTGLVESTGGTLGGLVAQSNYDLTLKDCWTSMDVQGRYSNQFAGGILGTCATKIHIENCYAAGRVSVTRCAGGIVGRCNGVSDSKVINCIAWNPDIASPRTMEANYSSGAVMGSIKGTVTLTDCYRRSDMIFTDPFIPYLCDHENVTNALPPLPEGDTDVNHYAYNGKAAPADATLASLAESLGWDPAVWNFSSESSALGFAIRQLGDNKIEF